MTSATDQAGVDRSRRQGPYASKGSKAVGLVPSGLRTFLVEAGGMCQLFGQIMATLVRNPRGFWVESVDQMFVTMKRAAIPVGISLSAFLMMITTLGLVFFTQLGATGIFPGVLLRLSLENFMVWAVVLVVAGIVGSQLTTELGARGVRDEIDALKVMGIDPIHHLVLPRFISTVVITTLIGLPSTVVTLLTQQVSGKYYGNQNASHYYTFVFENINPLNLVLLVGNCLVAGVIIATVCCYKGLNAGGGAAGLGKSVNSAVVVSFIVVWTAQTVYTGVTQGVLHLGTFR